MRTGSIVSQTVRVGCPKLQRNDSLYARRFNSIAIGGGVAALVRVPYAVGAPRGSERFANVFGRTICAARGRGHAAFGPRCMPRAIGTRRVGQTFTSGLRISVV